MISLKTVFSIIAVLLSATVLNAKEINVPKTSQAPVIDGEATDKCWDAVPWNSGFNLFGHENVKAPVETKFKLLHDNNNLYVLVVADEPFTNKIKADAKTRDSQVYSDDSIELFLCANDDRTTYYQFIINTQGAIYDAKHTQGGALTYTPWNAEEIKTKAHMGKDKWTLEATIPVVDLNGNSNKWLFNIGRNRTISNALQTDAFRGVQTYTFSGVFDQPGTFATLNFVDADFSKYNINVKPFYDIKTVLRDSKALFTARTFIQNNTGKPLFVKLKAGLGKGGKSESKKGISPDDGQEVCMEIPIGEEGPQQAYVKVYDYQTGALLGQVTREVKVKVIALEIKVTEPAYRNNIYATQELSQIAGNIIVRLDKTALADTNLVISLSGDNNEVVSSVKIDKIGESNEFSLPIPKLKPGKYALGARLLKNGQVIYSNSTVIRKLPKVADEYRLDKNGNALYNGKFFMPYGWYSMPSSAYEEEKKASVNITLSYVTYYYDDAKIKDGFDTANKMGVKVIIYAYPKRSMVNSEEWRKPLSDKDAFAIREFVNKWKNHPALGGWYLADEPFIKPTLPARLEAIYQTVSNADPYHLTLIGEDTVEGIYKYADSCDIMMGDPYPLFAKGGYAMRNMEYISKFSAAVSAQKGKGHWMVPQAFNYEDYGAGKDHRAPNFTELRCQQYKVITGGATGILWWVYDGSKKYTDCFYGVRYLAKEARLLKDVVEENPYREMLNTSDKLVTAAWYKNIKGHDYIIAVNTKVATLDVKIDLPVNKKWHVMSENREVQSNGKYLQDKFGIYGAHIYTTNKEIANKLSVTKIEQEIKEIKK
ncbi:MAG: sugar-binding protein [Phycisphaerae bacterium]